MFAQVVYNASAKAKKSVVSSFTTLEHQKHQDIFYFYDNVMFQGNVERFIRHLGHTIEFSTRCKLQTDEDVGNTRYYKSQKMIYICLNNDLTHIEAKKVLCHELLHVVILLLNLEKKNEIVDVVSHDKVFRSLANRFGVPITL